MTTNGPIRQSAFHPNKSPTSARTLEDGGDRANFHSQRRGQTTTTKLATNELQQGDQEQQQDPKQRA